MNEFIIEHATLTEMNFFLDMAKAEGWNPGLDDAVPFYDTDPNGFFIGKIRNKMIGCISAVAYNNHDGFLGFYIIAPQYRGEGYGLQLWNHALSYLGNRSIGLDGVVAQQPNYKKSGFQFHHNNIRYGGKIRGKASKDLIPINAIPFQTLLDFDTSVFGIERTRFLRSWIAMPNALGLGKVVQNQLKGYGIIRKCEIGYKIGPLFADSLSTAREIFSALGQNINESDIFLDVVQTNPEAVQLAQENGLKASFETARMYKGTPPPQQSEKIFGITSFELG